MKEGERGGEREGGREREWEKRESGREGGRERDIPVMNIVKPVEPSFLEALWDDFQVAIVNRIDALLRHAFGFDEPLR